ncbi:hypothetical protein [Massilia sp. CCM 8734]|uniref:hypothetical protein n=1 Tax=Massilia sp. CCM 8734 TaxID=2609283 RepID=UPI00141FA88D|nr:hypothetical protein [Massilia sp. CCM 8734]NHZ96990.1 hypothetical protein [Massilia sp. CCM 8734]
MLVSKGDEVKLLAAGSSPQACPVTALYDRSWVNRGSFHLELSDTIIYKDGKQVGRATYKVDRDASLLSQMANGDTKIEGMAEQLFPGKAGQ